MHYKAFISHSTKDRNLVLSISNNLKATGISVYLAEEDPQPGMNLPQKIVNNIKSADCMIVVLTDPGIRSQFVNQEIGVAKAVNRPIIPMVEKKVKGKIKGLLAGRELIIFDKANPKQAIKKVSSYASGLKLKVQSDEEGKRKKQEDVLTIIVAIIFIAFFAIVMFYALRKK